MHNPLCKLASTEAAALLFFFVSNANGEHLVKKLLTILQAAIGFCGAAPALFS
ncbi:MAG TPA: hypothetical protein VEC06_16525 [Paucimonas sp.]|nr:hypothetical protein [Paucimonas sp.]